MPNLLSQPDQLFLALGDPTRLAIVRQLCREQATVSQLAASHKMALPSFVQHLKVLEKHGWIRTHKAGRTRHCQLNPLALRSATHWLDEQRQFWERRLDRLDEVLYKLKQDEEKKA